MQQLHTCYQSEAAENHRHRHPSSIPQPSCGCHRGHEISMMESFMKSVYKVYVLQKSNSVSAPGVKSPALPTSRDEPLHFSKHKRFRTAVDQHQRMSQQPNTSSNISEVLRT
eukprot:1273003-Amphidinium_carterae.2